MSDALDWVDTGDLLAATGARNLTRSGGEWSFSCFSEHHAHGDSTPSAGMNVESSLWRCRNPACGLRGNAADYLAVLKGYTYSEALRVLQERYGGPGISAEPGALENEIERIRSSYEGTAEENRVAPDQQSYLDRFALHWPLLFIGVPDPMLYMYGRGFDPRVLNEWQIGYDDLSGRITVPIHDELGRLVGIKGRAWQQDNALRYLIIGDKLGDYPRYGFHTYMKSQYVFGLSRVQVCQGSDLADIFVVEGEINAIAMHQLGWANTVAVAGAEFSERQRELLATRAESVCVYFDGDVAGIAGAKKVAEMLHPYIPVSIVEGARFDAADVLHPEKAANARDLTVALSSATPYLLSSIRRC